MHKNIFTDIRSGAGHRTGSCQQRCRVSQAAFLILLADSVSDSARPGPAVPGPGSVPPSAPGDAVSPPRRLVHGAVKRRWRDRHGAALAWRISVRCACAHGRTTAQISRSSAVLRQGSQMASTGSLDDTCRS